MICGKVSPRDFGDDRCGQGRNERNAADDLAQAGFGGMTLAFLNYADELPYFAQEVLPRLEKMGIRLPR